ncbi:MAG: sigma-70 family RNA polymerase sigma factor [Ignavibacteria bacterium]|nr:sigma-70 family RNA polymerase sigma factor [Ignavibacteria bacterium]
MSSTSENIAKKEKDSSVINSVEEDISEENEFDLESDEFSAEEQQALSDEELKQKKIDFDLEAMPHMNLLHNYAYKMTFNQLDADDLLQETFLRAFRFFHKFEKGTNCKAWLFRIMKNLFINRYRKNQKEPGKVDYGEIENFFDTIRSEKMESSDLQQKVFSNLLDDDVTKALNSLQDDFKTVVILCDLEGLSYEEIADFVQCPIGTVRSRLHRGRKMLQEKLYEYAKVRGYDVENNLIK